LSFARKVLVRAWLERNGGLIKDGIRPGLERYTAVCCVKELAGHVSGTQVAHLRDSDYWIVPGPYGVGLASPETPARGGDLPVEPSLYQVREWHFGGPFTFRECLFVFGPYGVGLALPGTPARGAGLALRVPPLPDTPS